MSAIEDHTHTSQQASPLITKHEEGHARLARGKQLAGLLGLAIWFGIVTGLAEVIILAFNRLVLHKEVQISKHVAWMAPLADVTIFAIFAFVLFLLRWRWPKIISLRVVNFVFALLGFSSLLLMVPGLVDYVAFLLAAGLAVQIARLITAHPQGFNRIVRRTSVVMAVILVWLAVGSYGWLELAERRALAKLPPPPPGAPNVLLIVLDTVRAESLSLHGYGRPTTPQLERLAKRGIVFERAFSTASWTIPSHASMFTGHYVHELPDRWSAMTEAGTRAPTLAEVLSTKGYTTAGFVANLSGCGYETDLNRGFIHYEDYPVSPGQIFLSSSLGRFTSTNRNINNLRRVIGKGDLLNRKSAAEVNDDFLQWLSRKGDRPFFAFLNYFDSHAPYLAPEPFAEKFGPRARPKALIKLSNYLDELTTRGGARLEKDISQQQLEAQINAYDNTIAYLDHHLGLLFDELKKRGTLENTLVIITSDHGEEFGEHGLFGHAFNLYGLAVHVPLLVSFPARLPEGKIVREPVSLRDLPATVVDLIELKDAPRFPGNSLVRHLNETGGSGMRASDPPLSELSGNEDESKWGMKSLVAGRYHYIKNGNGREELYDIETDPFEKQDLANSDDGRQLCEQFRMSLGNILASNRRSK